jgi:DNA-binding CsgD family transcriptional regulator
MAEQNGIKLEPRDQQVLRLLAQGCSNKEIATFLNTSPRSVKLHLRRLFLELLVATKAAPATGLKAERHETEEPQPAEAPERKTIGVGLPCLQCRTYYPADLHICPICKSPERVPPNAVHALFSVPAIKTPVPPAATQLAKGTSCASASQCRG